MLSITIILFGWKMGHAQGGAGEEDTTHAIRVEDLIGRAHIPVAALTPDGRRTAYLLVKPDLKADSYEISVQVYRQKSPPILLRRYELTPGQTFDDRNWFKATAGDIRWLTNDHLLFTYRDRSKTVLSLWDARTGKIRPVGQEHDLIELQNARRASGVEVTYTSFDSEPPLSHAGRAGVPDRSWRIEDRYSFFGPFQNPKVSGRVRRQQWAAQFDSMMREALAPVGPVSYAWSKQPAESSLPPPTESTDSESWLSDQTVSPDGKHTAALEIRWSGLTRPEASFASFRIVSSDAEKTTTLVGDTRPYVRSTAILSWTEDSKRIRYLYVSPTSTSLNTVDLQGNRTRQWETAALLTKPCQYGRDCQIISADGSVALLLRSTNLLPEELVSVKLETGSAEVIESPNRDVFLRRQQPVVRFIEVPGEKDNAWGRLYLPSNARGDHRYPLVFTSYMSSPGFAESVGDEVPILAMVDQGIAVYDLNSVGLAASGVGGNFEIEVNRVRRPVNAMKRIAQQLAAEGVIDDSRIGVAGLSYGAEIAMYAYWAWPSLRAVSSATASWEPASYLLAGPIGIQALSARGFPPPEVALSSAWQKLSAGLNASAESPPLLLQSGEAEENVNVPTWTLLRARGARVEWHEYPGEGHIKVSPSNKWWAAQRNLDWFKFWLQDSDDGQSVATAAQYARWEAMKKLQQ